MNHINNLFNKCLCVRYFLYVFILFFSILSTNQLVANNLDGLSDNVLESRIYNMNSQIDMKLTKEVRDHIDIYTGKWKNATEVLLGRGNQFFPIYEKTLAEYDLPAELKYLSVVESGLRPTVRSKVGAVGLWQFMKGTGKLYNLKIGNTIDERKDVLKSTDAAARYLRDLFLEFNDWTLAIAAYNCGPGNVRKAIRRSGSRDFWTLRSYLPSETRKYVPKFIAVSYVMHYYNDHQLVPAVLPTDLTITSSVKLFDEQNFKSIARKAGVDINTVKDLNPSYLKSYIPKSNAGRHVLTLPVDGMNRFLLTNYSAQLIQTTIVKKLAQRLKLELPQIITSQKNFPSLESNSRKDSQNTDNQFVTTIAKVEQYEYYKLGKKETLISFVRNRDDVYLDEILRLNNYSLDNPPKPGAVMKVKKF